MAGRADRYDDIIMDAVHRIDNPPMHASWTASRTRHRTSPSAAPPASTALAMRRQGQQR